jgi:hypothetical protein
MHFVLQSDRGVKVQNEIYFEGIKEGKKYITDSHSIGPINASLPICYTEPKSCHSEKQLVVANLWASFEWVLQIFFWTLQMTSSERSIYLKIYL